MSKRYSGKSFKDSSVKKKPKLSLKEKKLREKSEKSIINVDIHKYYMFFMGFFKFSKQFIYV